MAIVNNPYLYSGGNVAVNTRPNVALYGQLQAQKAAKEEALNQYYNALPDKLNTAGVRTQDLEGDKGGIINDINAMKDYWMQNKDAIKQGGMAQQKYLAQQQNILRKIQQSKNAAKTELELGKLHFSGKYSPDDDEFHVVDRLSKSIYDPEFYKQDGVTPYTLNDIPVATPDFDISRQQKYWGNLTQGLKAGKIRSQDPSQIRRDETTGKVIIPFEERYSDDQIKRIADQAGSAVTSDKSARKYYRNKLNNLSEDEFDELQKAYDSVFPAQRKEDGFKVPNFINTPEKLAQAEAILKARVPISKGEEAVNDPNFAFELWKKKNEITSRQALQRAYIARQRIDGSYNQGNALDEIPDVETKGGKKIINGTVLNADGTSHTSPKGNFDIFISGDNMPASWFQLSKALGIDPGSLRKGVSIRTENGVVVEIQTPRNGIINRNQIRNAQLKANTEPLKGPQPQYGIPNNSNPEGPVRIPKDIKNTRMESNKKDPLGLFP